MWSGRQKEFKRNEKLETLLGEINEILEVAEDNVLEKYCMPRYPVIFIVGCARAGSTLMLQWLASTGQLAYPTNLLSRFYAAPYIGAKIQQLLTDSQFNFRDEFADIKNQIQFSSELGKTQGILAPNEFWYFWRRFFHYGEIQHLDESALQKVDVSKFVSEIAAIEAAFDKPFALKAHIINWNIPFLSSIFNKVLFIHITRQPLYNVQSLLESRSRYYGNLKEWYSFKPPEYEKLKECEPYAQVAGQVYFTNRAIGEGLEKIRENRWLKVKYEEFCKKPENIMGRIKEKFSHQDCKVNWSYEGPDMFESKNKLRLSEKDTVKIMEAYRKYSEG